MSDDLLLEATRALRETTAQPDPTARLTRARVMASVHTGARRRISRTMVLLPIAAVLVGTSAFGASGGRKAWNAVAQAIGIQADAPPVVPLARSMDQGARSLRRMQPLAAAPTPESPPSVVKQEAAPAAETDQEAVPAVAALISKGSPHMPLLRPTNAAGGVPPRAMSHLNATSGSQAGAPPNTNSGPAPDPALELYRAAHRAHFGGEAPAIALAAWDRYLAAAPRGRFALEASYNRAICLVRLGRTSEARQALAPFADGRFGEYRRSSAEALLAALPP
ncbi:MAG: hypothetical protein R3B13_26015 [Polyangiaceae bacterium]